MLTTLFKVYHTGSKIIGPVVQGSGNDPTAMIMLLIGLAVIGFVIYYLVRISRKNKI